MTDYSLTADDLELVRSVVRQQTAMLIGNGKESFVEARLKTLAQRLGVPTVSELLRRLRARETPALESHVAEVMTVNETLFFRDASPFTAPRLDVLPRLVERRAQLRRLEIWSAACSTGQEPLSVAIRRRAPYQGVRRERNRRAPRPASWNCRPSSLRRRGSRIGLRECSADGPHGSSQFWKVIQDAVRAASARPLLIVPETSRRHPSALGSPQELQRNRSAFSWPMKQPRYQTLRLKARRAPVAWRPSRAST